MKIKNNVKKFLCINIINMSVLFTCFIGSFLGTIKYLIYLIVLSIYYIYLLKKDDITIVMHQVYLFIISNVVLDTIFQYTTIQTPLEIKYITEFISVILIIKIIKNKAEYRNILKDNFMKLIFGIVLINTWFYLITRYNLIEFINALRIYFRFIPLYIVISYKGIDFKQTYKFLYLINLIAFVSQVALGTHRDLRNGIFGIIGGSCFAIFISIQLIKLTIELIHKEATIKKFLFYLALTILMLVISESKAFIGILSASLFIIILLNSGNILKKVTMMACVLGMLFLGANVLVKIYPNFLYLISAKNFTRNVEDYLFKNSNQVAFSMGRFEALRYISSIELDTKGKNVLGIGLGKSMPQENWFYSNNVERKNVIDFPKSTLFERYDVRLGYYLSSFNSIYLDSGVLGILAIIIMLLIILIRGYLVLIYGKTLNSKAIGAISILIGISSIYICGYGGGLLNRNYNYIVCILLGLLSYNHKKIHEIVRKKNV